MPKKPPYTEENRKQAVVETVPTVTIISNEILVESLIDAHLLYTGQVSGRQYEWLKGGDTASVSSEDVPELLEKYLGGNPCCGNPVGNRIFQLKVEV